MRIEELTVAKFGGTSLANAENFIRVANIIAADPRRRIIFNSAFGKDENNPEKITDLAISCGKLSFRGLASGKDFQEAFGLIERRHLEVARQLGVEIREDLAQVQEGLVVRRETEELTIAWAASQGEWLSGRMLARLIGAEFVDAAEVMRFNNDGTFNEEVSYLLLAERLQGWGSQRFVVAGFSGQDFLGRIRTFPRGGSDISAAHGAAAMLASLYENWTDTNGVLTADPRLFKGDPEMLAQIRTIRLLTYEEMAELSSAGARVFHTLALHPVWRRGIPVNIRNTFNPGDPGTIINGSRFHRPTPDELQMAGIRG